MGETVLGKYSESTSGGKLHQVSKVVTNGLFSRSVVSGGRGGLGCLALIGCALKEHDAGEDSR